MQIKHSFALLKPASSLCNLRCRYCFYRDEASLRERFSHGFMSEELLESIVRQYADSAELSCSFMFQGGEPLLVGKAFYRKYNDIVRHIVQEERKGFVIHSSVQTSAVNLDEEFASILKEGNFLIGISLDGPEELHDKWRKDIKGHGTFSKVMQGIFALRKAGADFNILCVITEDNAGKAEELLSFFESENMTHLQFIPALADFNKQNIPLSAEAYAVFFEEMFIAWFKRFKSGKIIHIRHIEDLFSNILYGNCMSCDQNGFCSVQNVIESDGDIYPCDFYAVDKFKIGNVKNGILNTDQTVIRKFLSHGQKSEECMKCPWFRACKGGCRRTLQDNGKAFQCAAVCRLFENHYPKIAEVAEVLKRSAH